MKRVLTLVFALVLGFAPRSSTAAPCAWGCRPTPSASTPTSRNATATRNMLENTYDTLVMFNSSLEIVPGLAESWEASDDALQWTFHLREATWHDGEPVTAGDVKFSIERIKDPAIASPRAGNFAVVESIDAPTTAPSS
jgi:peptide/nickel transport system substrate-binding protein